MGNGRNGKNGRKCADWLKTYLKYMEGQESPDIFHLWCGISAIAATLERNVSLDRGYYTLLPNLFVVLVSGSASARRSTAIISAAKLVKKAIPDMPTFSQKVTPEGIIGMLNEEYEKKKISAGYIVADEMSTFLGSGNKDASLVQVLTKLYDGTDFDYHTRLRGKELCLNPCVNMLAGSTPDWLKTSLPTHAIGGGFTGRIIFVHQQGSGKRVAFPALSDKERKLREDLIHDLRCIRGIKGEYTLGREAKEYYEEWYTKKHNPDGGDPSLRGYMARKHDTVLKVAIILSAAVRNRAVVTTKDLEIALAIMEKNEKFIPEAMRLIMATEVGEGLKKVENIIRRRGKIAYSDLLRQVSYFCNSRQLSEMLESLIHSGEIEECVDGNKRMYRGKG